MSDDAAGMSDEELSVGGEAAPGGVGSALADGELGPPIAFRAVREGTPVYDRDGRRIGVVERVVADEVLDIFEGLIVHTEPLPGRHLFASVDQIAELRERGALLSVRREQLHAPEPRPRSRRSDAPLDGSLRALLRRTWDRLSGA
jgi:hypothetical protein